MIIYRIAIILLLSILQTHIATSVIKNPDLANYSELLNLCGIDKICPVEPAFWIIASLSKILFLNIELYGLYFIHIFLIYIFLYYGIKKKTKSDIRSTLFILFWSTTFGVMHGLIQIRFGLACSILFYAFQSIKSSNLKISLLSALGTANHFSMILFSALSIFKNFYKEINFSRILIIHLLLIFILIFSTQPTLLNFLPSALSSRFLAYLNSESEEVVSAATTGLSLILYILLLVLYSPKKPTRTLLALSFLPYIVTPQVEILIRTIIPAQYILLSTIFYENNFNYKEKTSYSLLILFFAYKFYSGISAFESYLP